ncbi:MAG: alpha/beta hydrolase [Candidatus Thorarchaeota archaeon]
MGDEDTQLIVDISKVRSDIVKELMDLAPEAQKIQAEFLDKNPLGNIDFQNLIRNIRIGNRRWLRKEDTSDLITKEEHLYYAKMVRSTGDSYSYLNEPFPEDISVSSVNVEGIPAEWQEVANSNKEKVILYFHGGGFMGGSIKSHRPMTFPVTRLCGLRLLSASYRLAPEHPFPAALEDAVTVYKWLLKEGYAPSDILLMGLSAGGSISLSLLLKLRELGIELPAGAVLKSPGVKYADFSESAAINAPVDAILGDAALFLFLRGYAGKHDLRNPLISPYFADLSGLPPLLLQIGNNEMLHHQCKLFADKAIAAGVDMTFQEFPEMVHAWHYLNVPESKDAFEKIRVFVESTLK